MKNIYSIFLYGTLLLILGFTQQISAQQPFVHPGIPFTQSDLDQLKVNITKEPWLSAYNAFKNDSRSRLDYWMRGPFASVSRAPNLNNDQWKSDMQAIHNLAFMWWFTGDTAYAQKATDMLDAWAVTNTSWGGNESMLDIGDYAHYWATGAEILRYTYPGWTQANTEHVEKYFSQVLFPTSFVPYPLRDQNKGAIQLKIALGAAVFCNDVTKFNQAVEVYRMDAGGGMRNSLPNGEVGDTGRDDHWRVQAAALAWGAEVAYKQNVDMFSELDNRVLAIGELYHKYAFDGATMTYVPFGGYASYWTGWGIQPGARVGDMTNLIYSAYNVRKGIPTPETDRMRAALGGAGGDFLYLKSSDTSTAVSLPPVYYPADHVQPVNSLTNIDIGNTGLAGSASFNNGIWTLKGAGTSTSTAFSFNFKKVSGDAGLVVKIDNMSLTTGGCGVMLRESLAPGSPFWDIYLNATGGVGRHYQPKAPWWLKIERVGTRIFTYHSQDGVNWTNLGCAYSATGFPTDLYAGFYTISNNASVQNTATFSNVAFSQTAATGSPEISSATTATATIGMPFSYNIIANANPSSYNASGLPAGLSINTSTGVISGTATELGQNEVTITAANASGTGTATLILKVINSEAPVAPSSLLASIVNSTRISLSWTAPSGATSYSVKRSLSAGGPYTIVQSGIIGTSYVDAMPEPELNNYYVVTALAGELESEISNEVFASVPPAVPSKPVIVNKDQQIDLSWEPASGAKTYNVKRSVAMGGPYTTIASVTSNSYSDINLTNGNAYYYVISSVGNTQESGNSPETFGVAGSNAVTWSPTPSSAIWNQASNWVEEAVPTNPAIITFNASAESTLTNDMTGLEISRILFDSDANAYTIGGNSITLKSDLVNNSASYQTITTPVVLNNQLNINTNTEGISLSGGITGTGSLLKTGSRLLFISGINTYSGDTTINGTTGGWPPQNGIGIAGTGTGTQSVPTAGPLGTGKIIMNGGSLYSESGDATIYNDIEVTSGKKSYMYETSWALNLRGRLIGSGTLEHDGNTYAGLHLLGDNSGFTGTFISKLRSGNQRVRFEVPESGSAKAHWLLDANGVDCHSIQFQTGTLHFGGLSGRGYLRNNVGGSPVISIGALNTNCYFTGTFANFLNVEKVGTGDLAFAGNHAYSGTTTVKKGRFLLANNPTSGAFVSPVIVEEGIFAGSGKSTAPATIGTGSGSGAILEPGYLGIGTLTIGALTLNADATYKGEINLDTAIGDKINATSVNLLNSPKLTISSIGNILPSGTAYMLIDNTGTAAITGTFKDLPEMALLNIGGYNLRITYKGGTGNDVQLLDDRTLPVVITSSATETTLLNKPFTYTITGIKSPTSFNATGLPAGLSIDITTGVISGLPTEYGIFPIGLTASNSSTTGTQILTLTVQDIVVNNVIVASGDSKNIIEWEPIQDLSYNVKRSATSGGPYTIVGTVAGTKYTDTTVSNGTAYYYVVSSIDSTGENPNSTEVKATPNIGQVTYLKFDELSGTRSIDNWGANHGTLNTTANRSEGRNGQALKLDGTASSYASLPTGIVSTLADYSITAWVNMDELANWMRVFDFGTGTSKYMFLSAQAGASGQVRFAIKNGGTEQGMTYNYTTPLKTWTHFAITQSGSTCSMYINGALVATNTAVTIKPSDLGSTNQNYLGKSQWPDPMFKGAIDEFKIYSRALSTAEIAGSYSSQTLTLNPIAQKVMGDDDFDPSATTSSGLPVTYTSSNEAVATIVNGKVHIVSTGTATITASQAGNSVYWPAPSQAKVLTVVLTNDTQLTALISKPFTYTISNKALSNFTATGLPTGLTVDSVTGIISGTPTQFGVFTVTLTATNGSNTGSQTITLTVQNNVVSNVIVASGDAKNIIEWDPIQNFSYNIKRATTSGGPYTIIGNTASTKYTDTSISNGTIYYYVVSSVDGTTENSSSTEVVATPNTGQITYLKFDEQSGTRAIDNWGANHGTLASTATRATSKYSQALKLDGTANAYATLPTGIVSTLNDFTISSWVKMDALANWMRVFDFGTGTSKYMFLSVQTGSAGSIRYAIKNGGSEQGITYNFATPLNTWTHFAVTQSGNTCRIYINGTLVATNTGITIKPSTIGSTNQNYLGKSQWPDPMFKGSIDEFKIYNKALSASEIAESAKSSQTIALSTVAQKEMGTPDFSPATATSGLAVSYTSSNTAVASIVDGKLHIVAPGTSTITATQAGNTDYNAAPTHTQVLTVVKKEQTISFASIGAKSISDADFDAGATTSSGLPVTYSSSNTAVATIVDNKIHITGAGSAVITASQVGNDIYNAATSVTQQLTVNKEYYLDADKDGFGSTTTALFPVNEAPEGYAINNTDCNDSDATVHEPIQYYVDADKDGFGSTTTAMLCSSIAPEGYATNNTDCNDSDATVHQPIQYYVDADKDGFGSTTTAMLCSSIAPEGYATNNTDCNDSDATVHQPIQYYVDADKDGFGSTTTAMLCSSIAPEGYAINNTDCNDSDATVHEPIQYYIDADKDGFGSTTTTMLCSSIAPEGYAINNTDCNDSDATVHQPIQYYVDTDKDGFGSTATAMLCASVAPQGYATNNTDCDDSDATVHQPIQYYVDADKDGFGSTATAMLCASVAPQGYATNNTDCDDSKILYADNDGDGLGSNTLAACGVTNHTDCDDTNAFQLTATIPNVYALNAAVDEKNTIYIGYGPSFLSITATPAGGTAPYTYLWSTNQTAQTISVSAVGTYTVIVTDTKGCQTTASIVIKTINVQCGNSNDKVMVCHNNKEICVSPNSVQSHLDHGDKLGSCTASARIESKNNGKTSNTENQNTAKDVTVYPNPVTSLLNVKVSEVRSGATLELYNSLGMKLQSQTLTSTLEVVSLDKLPTGMYFLNIKNGNEITVKKIIKE
ncbi:putative secreted protein (Por secretion system target) [Flavobacterium sp. 1]|uniref:LamG-like jellyroll fold domain-containing protein n=1 Tax=Flavobacterium sp. 1 TaxID=2035200 RepID=UPI000C242839|nr:LamG-like jellyroll fold domain-containing protein [Flavobacterium sp. 1]PJJ08402.1 putative secreted protein (Por secretion system target) [Flavobacterium sp. 1]